IVDFGMGAYPRLARPQSGLRARPGPQAVAPVVTQDGRPMGAIDNPGGLAPPLAYRHGIRPAWIEPVRVRLIGEAARHAQGAAGKPLRAPLGWDAVHGSCLLGIAVHRPAWLRR